jgi:methionine synthase II (cobalamin-independent)
MSKEREMMSAEEWFAHLKESTRDIIKDLEDRGLSHLLQTERFFE